MPLDNDLLGVYATRMYTLLVLLEDAVNALEGTNKDNEAIVDEYHELMNEISDQEPE